jgi:FO synthase
MNESISRAAGTQHGQETSPEKMRHMIESAGRTARQRTTLYDDAHDADVARGSTAGILTDIINTPAKKYERKRSHELVRNDSVRMIPLD